MSHWSVTVWCIFLRLCGKKQTGQPSQVEEEAAEDGQTPLPAGQPRPPACPPGSGGQTFLGSGAATLYVYKTFSPRTDNQLMDLQTPWGWVSLFGEKELGSGINFFCLFLRNKKTELPLH